MSSPLPLRPRTVFLRDFVTMFTWCLCWAENHQDSPVTPRKELKWQKEHRKLTHLGMFPRVTSVQTLSKQNPRKPPVQGLPHTETVGVWGQKFIFKTVASICSGSLRCCSSFQVLF